MSVARLIVVGDISSSIMENGEEDNELGEVDKLACLYFKAIIIVNNIVSGLETTMVEVLILVYPGVNVVGK